MVPDGFRSVPRTRNSLFPPQNTPTSHQKKIFQNRFWDLETLFLLIWAWEGLKIHHFRGSQLEFFRLNHASSEHTRWVWNSRRQRHPIKLLQSALRSRCMHRESLVSVFGIKCKCCSCCDMIPSDVLSTPDTRAGPHQCWQSMSRRQKSQSEDILILLKSSSSC